MKFHRKEALFILGLDMASLPSGEMLKKIYRGLAMKHHPDREGGDKDKFQKVKAAYELIEELITKGYSKNETSGHWSPPNTTQAKKTPEYSKGGTDFDFDFSAIFKTAQTYNYTDVKKAEREREWEDIERESEKCEFFSVDANELMEMMKYRAQLEDFDRVVYRNLMCANKGAKNAGVDFIIGADDADDVVSELFDIFLEECGDDYYPQCSTHIKVSLTVEIDPSENPTRSLAGEAIYRWVRETVKVKCPHCIDGSKYNTSYNKPVYAGKCDVCEATGYIHVKIDKNVFIQESHVEEGAAYLYFARVKSTEGIEYIALVAIKVRMKKDPFRTVVTEKGKDLHAQAYTSLRMLVLGGEVIVAIGAAKYSVKVQPYTQAHAVYRLKNAAPKGGDIYVSFSAKLDPADGLEKLFS